MSKITMLPSNFCCGIMEIGNFGYTEDRMPNGTPHFHRPNGRGSDTVVKKAKPTTKQEVLDVIKTAVNHGTGAIITSIGVHQEYMEPILLELGFEKFEFKNRCHERTKVGFFILDVNKHAA